MQRSDHFQPGWVRTGVPVVTVLAVTLFAAPTYAQTTWYVDLANCPGPGSGTQADPFCKIQYGIDTASDGDTVLIADGTYTGVGNKNLSFDGKAITVQSQNGPDNCIVDCEHGGRGFLFYSGETATSVLSGVAVINGRTLGHGGGIYCSNSGPTFANCRIADCEAVGSSSYGGGLYFTSSNSPLHLDGCEISNNTARVSGGGVSASTGNTPVSILNCDVRNNTVENGSGGGLYLTGGSVEIDGCNIEANSAPYSSGGGGVFASTNNAPISITDSQVRNNTVTAGNGGGLYLSGGSVDIGGCNIEANSASYEGGGVFASTTNAPISITGCEVRNNTVEWGGGGGLCLTGGSIEVVGCVIDANSANNAGGIYCPYNNYPVTISSCGITNNSATSSGGGVYAWTGSASISILDSEIRNNTSDWDSGGGLYLGGGPVGITGCEVSTNLAGNVGGGAYVAGNYNQSVIQYSLFENNQASQGGGLYTSGNTILSKSTFSGNAALSNGGGIRGYGGNGPLVIDECRVEENFSENYGGGLDLASYSGYPITVKNSVIVDNLAFYGGAGMRIDGQYSPCPSVIGSTIASNAVLLPGPGGGGVLYTTYNPYSTCTIADSILWNDEASQGPEISLNGYYTTVSVSYSNVAGGAGQVYQSGSSWLNWAQGNLTGNPQFVSPLAGNYHLTAGSPCIDAGEPWFVPGPGETDMDGEDRVAAGIVDMGADEFHDCDADGIADYLQTPAGDCNGNGEPDDCDIVAGTSQDCNGNGQPDECETVLCDDNDPCTIDSCVIGAGCIYDPVNCDDLNACTADPCAGGSCQHQVITCDDDNDCTNDLCHPLIGCIFAPDCFDAGDCDDGDDCTADFCQAGCCLNYEQPPCSPCGPNGFCLQGACVVCDDGQYCNGVETCAPTGGCQPGMPPTCDDQVACTLDTCNPQAAGGSGACVNVPHDLNCADGNSCTTEYCDALLGCVVSPINCDDGEVCTVDSCTPALGCVNTPISCDDSNACTLDECGPITGCTHSLIDVNDGNLCTVDSCYPDTGVSHVPVDCDDSDACTVDTCNPATGCQHVPVVCNDGDACTVDGCNAASGCVHVEVNCNDFNACTADACSAGSCVHTVVTCDDGNDCTNDLCLPIFGCVFAPDCFDAADCDDDDSCTTDACDAAGCCQNNPVACPPGQSCDPATGDCASLCGSDLDGNGTVGPADLAILLGSWGPCGSCFADISEDGEVDATDLAILLGNWGACQ